MKAEIPEPILTELIYSFGSNRKIIRSLESGDWFEKYRAQVVDELNHIVSHDAIWEDRAALRKWRELMISLGEYVPVTPEELEKIVVLGGKKYDFKLDGTCYRGRD